MRKYGTAGAMTIVVASAYMVIACGSPARAVDLKDLRYVPPPQTDSQRLQDFKPPPPPPKQDTLLDKAARAYDRAPVRPSYDPNTKAPIIQYQRKW